MYASAEHLSPRPSSRTAQLFLLSLALLLTLLNAWKPLHLDDGCFWQYARHFAREPLDPYGFESFTAERPEPANETIAPPGLSYWWAIAIRLFGDQPLAWKLWLLPLVLLFVHSLHSLLLRFARGLELPLTAMLVLSPVVLPALNLMLDIPALALGLFGFALFLRASDAAADGGGRALGLAAAAGLVLGLASQTKYTAALIPAVLFVHAALFRRLRLWIVTTGIAAAIFVGWETFMALRYGRSHFLLHLAANHTDIRGKLLFGPPLLSLIGSVGAALLPLALAAFRRSTRSVGAVAAALLVPFLALSATSETYLWFAAAGLATLAGLLLVALRVARVFPRRRPFARARRIDWFLVSWLGWELLGYFMMSPFPAARRVLGVVVAGTVLCGRLASRTLRARGARRRLLPALAFGSALGALFFAVDLEEALATRRAVEDAAQWVWLRAAPGSRIFYVGHWGFQYYAERAGMIAAVDRQFYSRTILRAGDWLVVAPPRIVQQRFWIDPRRTEKAHVLELEGALPLRTMACYYAGFTPLERHDGPRMRVTIYHVKQDFPVRPYRGSQADPGP